MIASLIVYVLVRQMTSRDSVSRTFDACCLFFFSSALEHSFGFIEQTKLVVVAMLEIAF